MQPFTHLSATAVPLRMENVDTDQIIPAKYLTAVTKEGMGKGCSRGFATTRTARPKPIL
jgi:3-isopropylmalate/(R)-2-methylmalate dehydratase small subunit